VPQLDQEYQQRMEEVLEVQNQPCDEHAPAVALDERPVQLFGIAATRNPTGATTRGLGRGC
jgi:hypothetical protein